MDIEDANRIFDRYINHTKDLAIEWMELKSLYDDHVSNDNIIELLNKHRNSKTDGSFYEIIGRILNYPELLRIIEKRLDGLLINFDIKKVSKKFKEEKEHNKVIKPLKHRKWDDYTEIPTLKNMINRRLKPKEFIPEYRNFLIKNYFYDRTESSIKSKYYRLRKKLREKNNG